MYMGPLYISMISLTATHAKYLMYFSLPKVCPDNCNNCDQNDGTCTECNAYYTIDNMGTCAGK